MGATGAVVPVGVCVAEVLFDTGRLLGSVIGVAEFGVADTLVVEAELAASIEDTLVVSLANVG